MLDPKLVNTSIHVFSTLQEDLIIIQGRLFDETKIKYADAAIIRGLINLGLASLVGKPG